MKEFDRVKDSKPQEPFADFLSEPFYISVVYLPEEVNNASWLVHREEKAGALVMGIFCMTFAAAAAFWVAVNTDYYRSGYGSTAEGAIVGNTVALMAVLFPFAVAYVTWQFQKERAFKTYEKDPRFHWHVSYTIGSEGFQVSFPHATKLTDWTSVTAFFDLPESLCILIDGALFPLPKRCFVSEEQMQLVRRLIIDKGVRFSRFGKRRESIVYSGPPELFTIEIAHGEDLDVKNATMQEAIVSPSEVPGAASDAFGLCITLPHPDSALISEPLVFQAPGAVLKLECSYCFDELKSVDRLLFLKFGLCLLGVIYIALMVYSWIVLTLISSYFSFRLRFDLLIVMLQWTPLLLPCFGAHIWYVWDKRMDRLREMVKLDLPVMLELSESDCRMRTRRGVFVYPWHAFLECLSTNEHYICVLPGSSVIIPKRALDDSTKTAFVENLLRKKVQKFENLS